MEEMLLLRQAHLLLDSIGPHVGMVEAGLGVHVLRHHGHPVGQALGASTHSCPGPRPCSASCLGVAPPS